MGAFGASNRELRKRRRGAVDFRKEVKQGKSDNVERVHNRWWMIATVILILIALVWFGVI